MTHTTTLRMGIVGPGEPGHRVFESNFVIDCTCGRSIQCATTSETTAKRWMAEHIEWHGKLCIACAGEGVEFCADDDDIGDACSSCDGTGLR